MLNKAFFKNTIKHQSLYRGNLLISIRSKINPCTIDISTKTAIKKPHLPALICNCKIIKVRLQHVCRITAKKVQAEMCLDF